MNAQIATILEQDQVPIVTGGTAYYVQHLFLPPLPLENDKSVKLDALSNSQRQLLDLLPTLPSISSSASFPPEFPIELLPAAYQNAEAFASELWQILHLLSPERAAKWHWRDVRKVRRQIELLFEDNTVSPEVQQNQYQVLMFWLHCEREAHIKRLEERVDKMIEAGLIEEVRELYKQQLALGKPIDFSKGINQAIGYKPIVEYLTGEHD